MSIIDLDNDLGFMDHDEENCELYFDLNLPPISLQSKKKEAKQKLQASIHKVLQSLDFYLVGDISFHLLWNLHEHRRIETNGAADIDNILKPIIDAFTGFGALIIDDNQIDDVQGQWGHYYDYENDKFVVTINYEPNQLIHKDSLFLLLLEKNIYIPIKYHPDRDSRVVELKNILSAYNKRKTDIESEGYDRATRRKNRMQRLFHVGRIDEKFSKGGQSEYLG